MQYNTTGQGSTEPDTTILSAIPADGSTADGIECVYTPKSAPWYRRWYTITAAALAAAGLAAGLLFGVFGVGGNSGLTPAAQLKADGYSQIMQFTPQQLASLGGDSSSSAEYVQYLTGGVAGTGAGGMEVVVGVTPDGMQRIGGENISASLSKGETARVAGNNIIMDLPTSALAS
jgi:hypothetical protein